MYSDTLWHGTRSHTYAPTYTDEPSHSSTSFITSFQQVRWVWQLCSCWIWARCYSYSPFLHVCKIFSDSKASNDGMNGKSLPRSSFSPCLKGLYSALPCPTFENLSVVCCCLSQSMAHCTLCSENTSDIPWRSTWQGRQKWLRERAASMKASSE